MEAAVPTSFKIRRPMQPLRSRSSTLASRWLVAVLVAIGVLAGNAPSAQASGAGSARAFVQPSVQPAASGPAETGGKGELDAALDLRSAVIDRFEAVDLAAIDPDFGLGATGDYLDTPEGRVVFVTYGDLTGDRIPEAVASIVFDGHDDAWIVRVFGAVDGDRITHVSPIAATVPFVWTGTSLDRLVVRDGAVLLARASNRVPGPSLVYRSVDENRYVIRGELLEQSRPPRQVALVSMDGSAAIEHTFYTPGLYVDLAGPLATAAPIRFSTDQPESVRLRTDRPEIRARIYGSSGRLAATLAPGEIAHLTSPGDWQLYFHGIGESGGRARLDVEGHRGLLAPTLRVENRRIDGVTLNWLEVESAHGVVDYERVNEALRAPAEAAVARHRAAVDSCPEADAAWLVVSGEATLVSYDLVGVRLSMNDRNCGGEFYQSELVLVDLNTGQRLPTDELMVGNRDALHAELRVLLDERWSHPGDESVPTDLLDGATLELANVGFEHFELAVTAADAPSFDPGQSTQFGFGFRYPDFAGLFDAKFVTRAMSASRAILMSQTCGC